MEDSPGTALRVAVTCIANLAGAMKAASSRAVFPELQEVAELQTGPFLPVRLLSRVNLLN